MIFKHNNSGNTEPRPLYDIDEMSDLHMNSKENSLKGKRLGCVGYMLFSLSLFGALEYTSAFTFHATSLRQITLAPPSLSSRLFQAETPDQDIERTLARAKALLEKSKAKLAAKDAEKDAAASKKGENTPSAGNVPFFADREGSSVEEKRRQVTKSENEETGLITTDGEMMAKLSEEEKWEVRSLDDVFENEIEDPESEKSKKLAERDIAASIRSMRTIMQMEDYKKIFDPRNRFIGEDN